MNKLIANFERLWALDLVCRLGSVSAAAAALAISQPALSRKLAVLADELGFALLEKRGRHVALTDRAMALLPMVRSAFATLDACWEGQEDAGRRRLAARIGIVESIAVYLLPRMLSQLYYRFPDVEFRFQIAASDDIETMTKDGRLDCGISISRRLRKDIGQIDLYHDTFAFFATGTAGTAGLTELIAFPLRDRPMMKQVNEELSALRIAYVNRVEVSSFEVARALIRGAYGFGYLPERVALEDLRHGSLRRIGRGFGEHMGVFSSNPTFLRARRELVCPLVEFVGGVARSMR